MESAKSLVDFLDMTNGELSFYLKQRGLPYSGNHGSLAARCLVAYEQNLEVKPFTKELMENLELSYKSLLINHKIEDPLTTTSYNFSNNIYTAPPTNIGQIFCFILSKKAFQTDYIGQ